MEWIDVNERPLITMEGENWVCTDDGDKPFIAAIETNKGWWIRLCVMEDRVGLCVMGDDDNEPAGWDVKDVQFYMHLPKPPTK